MSAAFHSHLRSRGYFPCKTENPLDPSAINAKQKRETARPTDPVEHPKDTSQHDVTRRYQCLDLLSRSRERRFPGIGFTHKGESCTKSTMINQTRYFAKSNHFNPPLTLVSAKKVVLTSLLTILGQPCVTPKSGVGLRETNLNNSGFPKSDAPL